MQDLGAIEKAITPQTRLIWVETPSNPLLGISDIAAIVSLAKKHNILVACDNTVATSMNQRPLQLGADITMHSVTKYISGHSDVLGGALIFKDTGALLEKISAIQREGGSVPSPFEAWLTLRGMQTFPYRMRAHSENAQRVAEFLSRHAKIEAVHYPGLPSHPGHQIAARQMSAFGGLLSIQVKGGQADAFKVCAAVKIFTHATSLGGTHSFIEHRKSVEGVNSRSPENLLRLSVGLEHSDDLIEDFAAGIEEVRTVFRNSMIAIPLGPTMRLPYPSGQMAYSAKRHIVIPTSVNEASVCLQPPNGDGGTLRLLRTTRLPRVQESIARITRCPRD